MSDVKMEGLTLAVIGAGNMGGAVLKGILDSTAILKASGEGTAPFSQFIASVGTAASVEKLKATFEAHKDYLRVVTSDHNVSAARKADVVLLGCKPYMAATVLKAPHMRDALRGKLVISVLAGLTTERIDEYMPGYYTRVEHKCTIIRAMPNMAASIRESITVIAVPEVPHPPHFQKLAEWCFSQVGTIRHIADELFDAGGVLVGATGAFLAVAVDGLLDGAVVEGIKRSEAQAMLAQQLIGLGKLLAGGEHPALLREKISSPRGTTIEGLMVLEEQGVRSAFGKAVSASTARGRSMN